MKMRPWLITLLYFIPAVVWTIQAQSLRELLEALGLFAMAFVVAGILFYPRSDFAKRARDFF